MSTTHDINGIDPSTVDTDPRAFALSDWIAGAARVTRSVEVCGKPQLMGQIEDLKMQLERPQASTVEDDRPLSKDPEKEISDELERLRQEMLASFATWTFTSIDDDAKKRIRDQIDPAELTDEKQSVIGEFDYRIWAAQVVSVNGQRMTVEWTQLRELHGRLGEYFVQTISRTANAALRAEGVDVPFSLRSSALIAKSSSN